MRLLLITPLLAGCVTFSSMQGADTLPPGVTRSGVAVHATLSDPEGPEGEVVLPQLAVGWRAGLGQRVDAGVRGWPLGLYGDLKVQLLRGPVDLSLAPGAGAYLVAIPAEQLWSAPGATVVLPVLVGVDLGPHELLLAARLHGLFLFAPRLSVAMLPSASLAVVVGADLPLQIIAEVTAVPPGPAGVLLHGALGAYF